MVNMSFQRNLAAPISGQVSNQSVTVSPAAPQQHGNLVPSQVNDPNVHQNVQSTSELIGNARKKVQLTILNIVKRQQQFREEPPRKLINFALRVEESLFRSATTMEEYLDQKTLPSRLKVMFKNHLKNSNQQLSHANSPVSVGTMIPTPGFQQTVDSNLNGSSSTDSPLVTNESLNRTASSSLNSGSFSPAVSVDTGRNVGVPKMTSFMIPTPGISNSNDQEVNSNTFMNIRSSSNTGASLAVNSNLTSQPSQQRHNVSPNIGMHLSGRIQYSPQKSYGLSNGSFTGGLGNMRNNMTMMNGAGTVQGHSMGTAYPNSNKALQQLMMQGECSGSGNLYAPVTSTGSIVNTDYSLINNNQTSMYASQQTSTMGEHFVQPRQQQTLQHSDQFNCQKLAQYPFQQKNLLQNQTAQCQLSPNLVPEANCIIGSELHERSVQSQASNHSKLPGMQSQFQQNSFRDHSEATQILAQPTLSREIGSSLPQTSEHMHQMLHPQQLSANSGGDFNCLPSGTESDMVMCGQEYPISQNLHHVSTWKPVQNIQDVSHNRFIGQDVPERNNLYSKRLLESSRLVEPQKSNALQSREKKHMNQQRWLLFLRHARCCAASQEKCHEPNCPTVQKLLKHMEGCNVFQCPHPHCHVTKELINHHRRCRDPNCPVCVPVKNYLQLHMKKALASPDANPGLSNSVAGSYKSHENDETNQTTTSTRPVIESAEELQSSPKRMKIERGSQSLVSENERFVESASAVNECQFQNTQHTEQKNDNHIPVKVEVSESAEKLNPVTNGMKKDHLDEECAKQPEGDLIGTNNPSEPEVKNIIETQKEMDRGKPKSPLVPTENASNSGKPKIRGVSMTELFTPEQVRQHIMSLRQWIGQSKAKANKHKAMENSMNTNSCQLCAVEGLTFEPPPMYCTPCGARIKRKELYYTIATGYTCYWFCKQCYKGVCGDTIVVDGKVLSKAKLEKKKNVDEVYEGWVECDKCKSWQHQICALFNGRRNDGGQAEYTCPRCYIAEVERGERAPLPQSAVLGAKDLPRTNLSDHLEQRLSMKLHQEREERARLQGKSYDEVPGAEELVVRVVSSVDKRLDVKPRFLEIFREENYPKEFPYKSKVVLLFQNIEGVEVCLFGMYLQEYGSDNQQPNNRRVYLAYLDSVKYFRPDVKAVTGEALRTFVYHEILIGYLEHCKIRGFTSCYIWACPPLKGEDYILYCHPEIQKTPKSDKLREWYLSMLKKATKEKIVVELTNMYDLFFISSGERKAKVTASRLPYFDGDYWPGAAEDIIYQLQQVEDGKKPVNKGNFNKSIMKRALKASGQSDDLSDNASKDTLLMQKLGETISPMKEDFIMVHLQHACAHCCILIVSGNRWVCKQCKNFQLCDKCYDAERKCEERDRHPTNQRDKHALYPVEITAVADDTKDNEILESEFFDTRLAFLNLCQGNHYQYDTLRRAKHSSMMVLYHLHNPTAPAFVTACSGCQIDIETGQGWRCEKCPEYEVCNSCYQKEGGVDHPHKLIKPSAGHDTQNKEARQARVRKSKTMLELIMHASVCKSPHCHYPFCLKVKELFRHTLKCTIRASRGCVPCKKIWYMLQVHARACKESECPVPRCSDLKAFYRRGNQQIENRRRAAVNEMMRLRAAEVSGRS